MVIDVASVTVSLDELQASHAADLLAEADVVIAVE